MIPFMSERRRRRSRRGQFKIGGGRRRSREFSRVAFRNGAFIDEVLKPGAVAAVGLVGTRLLSQQVARLTASIAPSSPNLAKWVPSAVSAASAWGVWALAGRWNAIRPYRGFLAIGAGLAVVEELLAVVLPIVGIAPGIPGISGTLGNALYGTDNGMGFPCFTGGCPQGVAVPFPNPPCSNCPPGVAAVATNGNGQPVMAPMAGGMGFPCFTGGCPQGVAVPFPNPPCSNCPPDLVAATTAANVAVAQSGFTDPVAQQVLAGLTNKAQDIMNAAGIQ